MSENKQASPYDKLTQEEKEEIAKLTNRLCDLIEKTGQSDAKVDMGEWKVLILKQPKV